MGNGILQLRSGELAGVPVLQGAACGGSGGPGPLEIEAAEVAGDVDHFSDEVETWDVAGLHGLGGETGGIDATGGDFGFFVAFGAGGLEWPVVQAGGEGIDFAITPDGYGLAGTGCSMKFAPAVGQALGKVAGKQCPSFGARTGGSGSGELGGEVEVWEQIDFDGFTVAPI